MNARRGVDVSRIVRLLMEDPTNLVSCTHGEDCGACALLDVRYDHQLGRKRDLLARALGKHPVLRRTRPLSCLPSPLRGAYRNRAKMAVGLLSRSGVRLGYFRTGTREIVGRAR